ncbi:mechanosensitive ion channel domain-containing protein [Reichenbachiella sp. MALMAid0571]|uniref:mechanosensitive ion channel family protein n=1 Tax=Reichenbachiella sp. MALMAid0571 TaxID=3143939 RepID=UPI0032DE5549
MTVQEFIEFKIISFGDYFVTPLHIMQMVILIIVSWTIILISKQVVQRQINSGRFDKGRGKALFQILNYSIIVLTIIAGLDMVGVKITLLLAGSAALLVGVGLGLQQVFNDIVSGILLLFEGTVTVGDIIELNNIVGKVEKISIRTSKIETRDGIVIIVPNSKLVSDNVINWSHNRSVTRFRIKVGVAYGSDVSLVMKLLSDSALEHPEVVRTPEPKARFIDFGESSLDFELLFYSKRMFDIEFVRSDIRVKIDQKFRENNITIPFPQRDLHFKTSDTFSIDKTK